MEAFDYHDSMWMLKLAQLLHPKFDYRRETETGGAQWAFVGTCEDLLETISEKQ